MPVLDLSNGRRLAIAIGEYGESDGSLLDIRPFWVMRVSADLCPGGKQVGIWDLGPGEVFVIDEEAIRTSLSRDDVTSGEIELVARNSFAAADPDLAHVDVLMRVMDAGDMVAAQFGRDRAWLRECAGPAVAEMMMVMSPTSSVDEYRAELTRRLIAGGHASNAER